jgi:hypothetical protein|tara:strand:+ start:129 stop:239 length:111 start_codon:yes stop_codon:yes gene_type:complete
MNASPISKLIHDVLFDRAMSFAVGLVDPLSVRKHPA